MLLVNELVDKHYFDDIAWNNTSYVLKLICDLKVKAFFNITTQKFVTNF